MTAVGSLVLRPGAFRLLLAGLVVLSHISNLQVGRLGVALFFLLSGFWISDLWNRQARFGNLLFFINRFLRIWPLYILVVLASAWLHRRALHLPSFTIFGVASMNADKPIGVEWSLDIEAQFYVLLPAIMTLGLSAWLVVPATIMGWAAVYFAGIHNVLMYIPAFAAGMMLYRYRDRPIPIAAGFSVLAFLCFSAVAFAIPATRGMLINSMPDVVNEDVFAMAWGALLVPYIGHSLRRKSSVFDRHLGNLSFPLYLVHEPIIQALMPHGIVMKIGLLAIISAVAIAFYIAIDIPIERIRHALLKRLEARQMAAFAGADEIA